MSNERIFGDLKAWSEKVKANVKRGVAETTVLMYTEASSNAPVDTSYLKQSIDYTIDNGGLNGIVSVGADYAKYIEYGTGIYATKGSRAKSIPWTYKGDDGEFHTTYGQAPQPFWHPALDISRSYFKDYFGK